MKLRLMKYTENIYDSYTRLHTIYTRVHSYFEMTKAIQSDNGLKFNLENMHEWKRKLTLNPGHTLKKTSFDPRRKERVSVYRRTRWTFG
jgi:hypothetical protein